ncbi:gluconate operon transcriptional repressor GntR [Vibrio sp. S17_S38]|uniref:gluconate operon transcriptional repressor GntR n=1 Tax=Vibrio sp. S17_S38 TaxID=2720229 RepID=UPI0016805DF6|nr:gluconate operon transcriptional repressor GntR [Vibrio sp. S17_S38]MBD1574245.1 gluconate operon transcriptional repressor GntR [Vibrio sp. S17_S38]
MKKRRPNLQDIADEVGVTKMTVSRCLRDSSKVSSTTYQKIMEVIDRLGYIPNKAPELLSNSKSRSLGVLVPSLTNHVFAEVIRGIENITEAHGYQTMLAHYGYSQEIEEERISNLLAYHVDGLILSESQHSERTLKMIETSGVPVVEIMDLNADPILKSVGFDNEKAGYEMTSLMVERGCKQIVYLGARLDERTKLKLAGYNRAMTDKQLLSTNVLTDKSSSFSLGAELLNKALAMYPSLDGVFCTNDDLAIGALFECQRLGIKVPQDISIAGFHGHDVGQAMEPKLASVITPRFEIGQEAAKQLLESIKQDSNTKQSLDLGFTLFSGGTI